ncbi:MAG: hypothetical protein KF802_01940 [Bdellovibrionaceae bacterium]|nr:hypothetical protein [Pseudobdellovibrionaceae bacterium]MBX3033922.1 hypothetical protein [Pseudobdellovibrionaceae bacterium]
METWFIISAVVIFILSFVVYGAIAVFFPEWVGISGRVHHEVERTHEEGTSAGPHWDGESANPNLQGGASPGAGHPAARKKSE